MNVWRLIWRLARYRFHLYLASGLLASTMFYLFPLIPGLIVRWFFDTEGAVGPLYQSGDADPAWFLFDPTLRLLARAPIAAPEALFASLAALPPLEAHAGAPMVAPVLIVPRVFEPEFCRRLIAYYDAEGGTPSGVLLLQRGDA